MVDIAALDKMLRKSKSLPSPPPINEVDVWPECFNIDRAVVSEPSIRIQHLIGPPTARILIRGPLLAPMDWIRSSDLPLYADRANEYHHGNNYWLPIPTEWFDVKNWSGGYWRPHP